MIDIKFLINYLPPVLCLFFLSACALSPQTISLTPEIEIAGSGIASGTTLVLEIRDARKSNVIGYRGGIYDTATISTEGDISGPIFNELSSALGNQGFSVVPGGSSSYPRLLIELRQLNYNVQKNNIIWSVEIFAEINANVRAGTKSISHNLEDRFTKDFPKSPSTTDNEKMINDVVSRLLQRVLEDDSITGFLTNNR